jgi:iron complex outermembrane receptor protein
VNLNMSEDLGWATLTSITSYQAGSVYGTSEIDGSSQQTSISGQGIPRLNQTTQELRLSSNGKGPLSYQAGLYYFNGVLGYWNTSVNNINNSASTTADSAAYQVAHQNTNSYAVFGQVKYRVADRLTLTGACASPGITSTSSSRPAPIRPIRPTFWACPNSAAHGSRQAGAVPLPSSACPPRPAPLATGTR